MVDNSFETAMNNLYTAKWNVPKAADHSGLTWEECKRVFREYCLYKSLQPSSELYYISGS